MKNAALLVLAVAAMSACATVTPVPPTAACDNSASRVLTDPQGRPAKARHFCFEAGHVYYVDRNLTLDELKALTTPPPAQAAAAPAKPLEAAKPKRARRHSSAKAKADAEFDKELDEAANKLGGGGGRQDPNEGHPGKVSAVGLP